MPKLGDVAVDPPLFPAPLAEVTDRGLRLIVGRVAEAALAEAASADA